MSKTARTGFKAPVRAMPSETAGLKKAPLTRAKVKVVTMRDKPAPQEM